MTDHSSPDLWSRATLMLPTSVAMSGARGPAGVRTRRRTTTDSLPRGHVLDDDRARADRIVAVYALAAAIWIVLSSSITAGLAAVTSWSPAAIEILKGLLFVGATAVVLRTALQHWASRLTTAAELEQRAADDLLAVARLRAAFLASISHELRTPLTNITGYAHTIRAHRESLSGEQIEHFAERLTANSDRLEQLVLDMLELHRPAKDGEVVLEPVHLEHLLRSVVADVCTTQHEVRVWSPITWVQVDRDKLSRVLEELVANVCRHTPEGTRGWISATAEDGWLDLVVEDDGPGVDPSVRAAVTEPFVQGTHVEALASPGLGIGLALVTRYAELLGGGIAVTSPRGGGTRVTISVPFLPVAAEARTSA